MASELVVRVESRRTGEAKRAQWKSDGWRVVDVTSRSNDELGKKLSPFYPHGGIPIPGRDGTAASVEGIWQGLKIMQPGGTDERKFTNTTGRKLKRAVPHDGRILGHRWGTDGILSYVEARERIYVPTYTWMLDNKVDASPLIEGTDKLILLDYDINPNIQDTTRPLSHASLIRTWLMQKKDVKRVRLE